MALDRVPPEVLQIIFDYLTKSEQLEKTQITRRWNQLSFRKTHLVLANAEQLIDEDILGRTTRGYSCFSIDFKFIKKYEEEEELRSRLAICANKFSLRSLNLYNIPTDTLISFIHEHRDWLRSVTELAITASNRVDLSNIEVKLELPKLRKFRWVFIDRSGSSFLPSVTLRAPQLKEIDLNCYDSTHPSVVLENATRLESLRVKGFKLISNVIAADSVMFLRIYEVDQPFEWCSEHIKFQRLGELSICACNVNIQSQKLLSTLANLQTLIIESEKTNPIDLGIIARALPQLKELRLSYAEWTYKSDVLSFPFLQIFDVHSSLRTQTTDDAPLSVNAPHLMVLKGTPKNIEQLEFTNFATIKTLIALGQYLNFRRPRLFGSVRNLYMEITCHVPDQLLVTESIHQFPNLTHLTVILHNKQSPVNLSGNLIAISFPNLRYLHLRYFDLDSDFMSGVLRSNTLSTLILEEGSLASGTIDVMRLEHFYMRNVKIPTSLDDFADFGTLLKLVRPRPRGNKYSTKILNETFIKSREEFLTDLQLCV
ncbi:uncharacterized protein LOC129778445 [Toxorhynchites rutilus septentrionalis]|uniref:uncharacterized protein LOC129778445 n=1 Tax=Toxorhynchites rutilus septentrionalis TaxID=329112 RepID=UPI0024785DC4|nr:uncharacterized protein LOC129778445 [Toxorhynchites rutilus septentrionalis]